MKNLKNKVLKKKDTENNISNSNLLLMLILLVICFFVIIILYVNNYNIKNTFYPAVAICKGQILYSWTNDNGLENYKIYHNVTWYSDEFHQYVRQLNLKEATLNKTNCHIVKVKEYNLKSNNTYMEIKWH